MNDIYVWYSKTSEESGKVLAQIIGTDNHGLLPPKDFKGSLVCYGAVPTDKFRWDARDIRFTFNDPRVVRKYVDRADLFSALARAGMVVPDLVKVDEASTFDSLCESLVASPAMGISLFKINGAEAKVSRTELGLGKAKKEGAVYASTAEFVTAKRTRCFIADGAFIGAIAQSNAQDELFAKAVAEEQTIMGKEEAESFIRYLTGAGIMQPLKYYWMPQAAVDPALAEVALKAAKTLGLDFCAIDLVKMVNGSAKVLNVVSTPNIVGQEAIHGPLSAAIKLWLKRAQRTAKEILSDIVKEASEEEAQAIVGELRKIKEEAIKVA